MSDTDMAGASTVEQISIEDLDLFELDGVFEEGDQSVEGVTSQSESDRGEGYSEQEDRLDMADVDTEDAEEALDVVSEDDLFADLG